MPWLARSRFRDLITRPGRAVLAVRWETGGHYGEPFPVLDADLTLTPAGPSAALLELSGIYRADPGEDGPRMGAVVLGGFVDRIAETTSTKLFSHAYILMSLMAWNISFISLMR